ncbi:MAG: nucleotidyltransferase family protein [Deltaproteobacteria bacterium]|nr:nucleotidyltransferase family protein [Deltaproteobacteria bacterium]
MKAEKIDVIILAGGLGTRLKGTVPDLPKALSPIRGRPFLDYVLDALEESNVVKNVILAVGHMADQIVEQYTDGDEYSFDILFSREETLLGTGGAIKKALRHATTDNVMALNGDSYVDVRLEDILAFHGKKQATITVIVKKIKNSGRYGLVAFDDNHMVASFNEKQENTGEGYINTGVYIFKRGIFNRVEEEKVISLEKELMPLFIHNGGVYAFATHGKFIDIGIPETYLVAEQFFQGAFDHKSRLAQ